MRQSRDGIGQKSVPSRKEKESCEIRFSQRLFQSACRSDAAALWRHAVSSNRRERDSEHFRFKLLSKANPISIPDAMYQVFR